MELSRLTSSMLRHFRSLIHLRTLLANCRVRVLLSSPASIIFLVHARSMRNLAAKTDTDHVHDFEVNARHNAKRNTIIRHFHVLLKIRSLSLAFSRLITCPLQHKSSSIAFNFVTIRDFRINSSFYRVALLHNIRYCRICNSRNASWRNL